MSTDEVVEVYRDLKLRRGVRENARRPYAAINMVASVDGRASAGGKASGIGGAADRAVMRVLRSKVDAVVIGAGTLRAERLSLGLDASHGGSIGKGREDGISQPLAVVVTSSGDVALENLVQMPGQRVLVFAAETVPGSKIEALLAGGAEVIPTKTETTASGFDVDLKEAVEKLSEDFNVGALLLEGGPTLNRAMISAGLVDELFLTLAPKLLGGTGDLAEEPGRPVAQTVLGGEQLVPPIELKLLSAQRSGDELFLRYAL